MKYIEYINKLIQEEVLKQKNLIVYGQNIAAGSCLGGLTKNLQVEENGKRGKKTIEDVGRRFEILAEKIV